MNGNDVVIYSEKHFDRIMDILVERHPDVPEETLAETDEFMDIAMELMLEG